MRASISFDRIADRYEETRGGLQRGKRVAGYLWPYLRTARTVLEVGAGTGVVSAAMQHEGFSVTGVDISVAMLSRARGRLDRAAVADATRLPFADASFEQAYTAWVMHLVGDPAAVLAEIARVLATGGRYLDITGGGARVEPDPIGEAIEQMEERLQARAWSEARTTAGVAELARAAGFRAIEERLSVPLTHTVRPSQVAERIESRAYSYLWDLDDGTWGAVVEPALARLRALPDEPVNRIVRDHVVVMERVRTIPPR